MKKIFKFILGFVAVAFIIIVVFWGSFVYVSDYKITEVDTSISQDGTHELVLQAVGEADFPFGSASGRLILYEGKNRISKADFELFDDGGCIRSSIFEVTWHEDCVEVILYGDEQILYKFPYMCEDNKRYYTGCFDSIEAVAFRDINDDGKEDIMTDVTQHILGKDMII